MTLNAAENDNNHHCVMDCSSPGMLTLLRSRDINRLELAQKLHVSVGEMYYTIRGRIGRRSFWCWL